MGDGLPLAAVAAPDDALTAAGPASVVALADRFPPLPSLGQLRGQTWTGTRGKAVVRKSSVRRSRRRQSGQVSSTSGRVR